MKILFPDTNLFLQCKDLSQINWGDIAGGMDLCLLISRPVQEEIDRLKNDGNKRRSRKARKANSLIGQIIDSEDFRIVIKDSGPKVEISVSLTKPQTFREIFPEILDYSLPDDRIIVEAIAYKNQHPDVEVAIITNDSIAKLNAKRCNFDFIVIPDEWLLEPETDEREKRIIELERRIKELGKNYPEIEIGCNDKKGNSIDNLSISIIQYRELTEKEIDKLVVEAQSIHPMEKIFNRTQKSKDSHGLITGINAVLGITQRYIPPTEEEIERYKKEEYPHWIETIKEFFKALHQKLESPFQKGNISVSIKNIGNVPAENLITEFLLNGGFLFIPPSDKKNKNVEEQTIKIPLPPAAPSGRLVQRDALGTMLGLQQTYTSILGSNHAFPSIPTIPRFNLNRDRTKMPSIGSMEGQIEN